MRRFFGLAAVLVGALLWGQAAHAQQPLPVAPCASVSLQAPPCVCPAPDTAAPYYPQRAPASTEPLFAVDLMLGQVTGVRGQYAAYRDSREALVVEGFYGVLFHNLGSTQALGAGARYLFFSDWPELFGSVAVGPGADVFFQLNHNALILLTPSIDLAYIHPLGGGLEFEVGVEAGLGIGISGHTKHGHSAVGDLAPLFSVYTGLRF
jgi:hypothetical protein